MKLRGGEVGKTSRFPRFLLDFPHVPPPPPQFHFCILLVFLDGAEKTEMKLRGGEVGKTSRFPRFLLDFPHVPPPPQFHFCILLLLRFRWFFWITSNSFSHIDFLKIHHSSAWNPMRGGHIRVTSPPCLHCICMSQRSEHMNAKHYLSLAENDSGGLKESTVPMRFMLTSLS